MSIFLNWNSSWLSPQENNYLEAEDKMRSGFRNYEPMFTSEERVSEALFTRMENWAASLHVQKVEHLIVIGIGGSSLGGKVISELSANYTGNILFWEGPHPKTLKNYAKFLEYTQVALLWVSKSGTTLESRINLALVREYFKNIPEFFVTSYPEKITDLCSDPDSIFEIPKRLSGRFSIISPAGIMPGLFLKAPMRIFLDGFYAANQSYDMPVALQENPAKQMALSLCNFYDAKYSGVIFWIYNKNLLAWGDWILQLWSESLGKKGDFFLLPYKARGPEDQHSTLQYFLKSDSSYAHIFVHTKSYAPLNTRVTSHIADNLFDHTLWEILDTQMKSVEYVLDKKNRPICEYAFSNLYTQKNDVLQGDFFLLGKWISYWMHVITYKAYLLNINPFDQPDIELHKVFCNQVLSGTKKIPEILHNQVREI